MSRDAHSFRLEAFEGPIALLLHLIERSEIDIYDIPIAGLTEQYLAVISENAAMSDPESMSEFIVMAATLLEIKSKMLLPKPPAPEDENAGDPRDALVRKLLEYKRCQALAEKLKALPGERFVNEGERGRFINQESADIQIGDLLSDINLNELWRVFADIVLRREQRIDTARANYGDMPRERFTVGEKIAYIEECLRRKKRLRLFELFETCESRGEMVVTFLALLEIIRRERLRVRQPGAFKDIEICPA